MTFIPRAPRAGADQKNVGFAMLTRGLQTGITNCTFWKFRGTVYLSNNLVGNIRKKCCTVYIYVHCTVYSVHCTVCIRVSVHAAYLHGTYSDFKTVGSG